MQWLTLLHDFFIQPFLYPFMARALGLGLFAALVCSILSCFIVTKGWSLIGDALSHAVLPGIVLAYLLNLPLALGAILSGISCVAMSNWFEGKSKIKPDALLGIAFTSFLALGLVLVTAVPSNVHFMHILLGNLLGIDVSTRWQLLICGSLALCLLLLRFSDLRLYCFDDIQAQIVGIPIHYLRWLLLIILGLTTIAVLQTVGMILAVAMLVTPGCIGYLASKRFVNMVCYAMISALLAVWWGLSLSFALNAESGGCIVIVQFSLFLLVLLVSPKRRSTWRFFRTNARITQSDTV